MTAPLWVYELASTFWSQAGMDEPFPRTLRRPIARALPLTVTSLPALRVAGVDRWLRRNGVRCGLSLPDRPLRACLIAHRGHGIVFLDGTDPADQERFSLAHELAHFLHDYWSPRHLARSRLGERVLEVVDGERAPDPDERVHALLTLVPIGLHVHLMERPAHGSRLVDRAEREADRLAFELLAPADAVLAGLRAVPLAERPEAARTALVYRYGLPGEEAARYASLLVPAAEGPPSFIRRLRIVR